MKKNSCTETKPTLLLAIGILCLAAEIPATFCTEYSGEKTETSSQKTSTPRLTILFVIDQGAYSYLQNVRPYFTGGLKYLIDEGVNYTNAYWPHATPVTAVGHAGLSTGTFARYHGIVGNSWYTNDKTLYADNAPELSAQNIMVDGLSDQFMLAAKPLQRRHAYALSSKARAAIMLAGKGGKALWFNYKEGAFCSSKAYFEQLPIWATEFNEKKNIQAVPSITWQLIYPEKSPAYAIAGATDYTYSSGTTLIDQTLTIDHTQKIPYEILYKNPYANKLLLELGQQCINGIMTTDEDHLLLWISLSSLDAVAHEFGPNSREALDVLYHLDKDLEEFFKAVWRKIDKNQTLVALTADHGVMPILEKIHEKGFQATYRITPKSLITTVNDALEKKYGLEDLIIHYKNSQLFFDNSIFTTLEPKKQSAVIKTIKQTLKHIPGIKSVWTAKELDAVATPDTDAFKFNYAQQRYQGRTGQLFIQPLPYTLISKWPTGTAHKSPYNYDTHVPLIIYQPGRIEKKVVTKKVWPLSLAPTVADILEIPRPSAATEDVLPGIFK